MIYRLLVLVGILGALLSSCGAIVDLLSKNVDSENKEGVKSKFNDDNAILIEGKEFIYDVIQKEQNQTLQFQLSMKVIPGKYNGETKIKYKYYYVDEGLTQEQVNYFVDTIKGYKWEVTSADDRENYFDLHPPRSYSLNKLELAPFPRVYLTSDIGSTFSTVLKIGPGWGENSFKSIFWQYEIAELIYYNDSLTFTVIKASSNWGKEYNEDKICNVEFLFNSHLGFTKMSYLFSDSTSIEFLMK